MAWDTGTTSSCCGDDSSEYYEYRNSYFGGSELWFDDSTSDDECCNADTECVYNGICYAGAANYDLNGDGKKEARCTNAGSELVINGGAEFGTTYSWSNFNGVTSADSYSGTYSFYREGTTTVYSSEYIPVDVNKQFNLSGWFKTYGTENSTLYFGYIPYDENQTQINSVDVNAYSGTGTTLYQACAAGDKIVRITDGTSWVTAQYAVIAFNVDDSGNYNDLPNRNVSNYNITRVQNMGSYWEVEFNTNVGKAAPAGTKIREHTYSSSYMYDAASGASVPPTWTKYSATTTGENLYGINLGKWWRGTKFAVILMLLNYAQSTSYKLRVDGVSLTSTQPQYSQRWINTDYSSSYCTGAGCNWSAGGGDATGDSYAGTWGQITNSSYCYNRSTEMGGSFVASRYCCCEDDANEYYRYCNYTAPYSGFPDSGNCVATDTACCDTSTDCVNTTAGGECITSGTHAKDADGDGDNDYCLNNQWYDCYDTGDCLVEYGCSSNDCIDVTINGGSGATCDGSNPCFYVQNNTGSAKARFDDNGNIDVKGSYSNGQGSLSPPANSFVLHDSSGNPVLYIDSNGNLATKGYFHNNASPTPSGSNDFIIMDSGSNVAGFIDGASGNMTFKGSLHYNSDF